MIALLQLKMLWDCQGCSVCQMTKYIQGRCNSTNEIDISEDYDLLQESYGEASVSMLGAGIYATKHKLCYEDLKIDSENQVLKL